MGGGCLDPRSVFLLVPPFDRSLPFILPSTNHHSVDPSLPFSTSPSLLVAMPVDFSDYSHLPLSEQELIQSHIMQPNRFMSPLLMAGMLDALLFGVLVTEVWSYHRWFNDTYKFKGGFRSQRRRGSNDPSSPNLALLPPPCLIIYPRWLSRTPHSALTGHVPL